MDHIFILSTIGAPEADALISFGGREVTAVHVADRPGVSSPALDSLLRHCEGGVDPLYIEQQQIIAVTTTPQLAISV